MGRTQFRSVQGVPQGFRLMVQSIRRLRNALKYGYTSRRRTGSAGNTGIAGKSRPQEMQPMPLNDEGRSAGG